MTRRITPKGVVALSVRIGRFVDRLEAKNLKKAIVDLADLYAAAREYCAQIEFLTAAALPTKKQSAARLVQLEVLLYDEVQDHLDHLKKPLAAAIDRVYEQLDDGRKGSRRNRVSRRTRR